jgi:hypothetical protein
LRISRWSELPAAMQVSLSLPSLIDRIVLCFFRGSVSEIRPWWTLNSDAWRH